MRRIPHPTHPHPTPAILLLSVWIAGAATAAKDGPASDPLAALREALRQADAALAEDEPQIAESRYRTALLEGWLLLGALEHEEGRPQRAKQAFERAAAAAVEVRRPHMALALVEVQLGEAERAVALLRSLMARDRSDAAVRRLVPRALMAAGRVDEAIQDLEELRVLAPHDLENAYTLARAYLGQDRGQEAAALFAELSAARPMAATHVLVGRTWRDFDDFRHAREELRKALELDPRVPRAHYYLGTVDLLDQGQDLLDQAMEHFEAELRVSPQDPLTNLYLGIALVERRRHQEAVPRLEVADRPTAAREDGGRADAGPGAGRADAFQFLGRAYLALDRVDEAIAAFRRGLLLAEAEPEPVAARGPVDARQQQLSSLHFQLAQALRRRGDEAAAAPHFDAAKRFSAGSAQGARELLEAYFKDEDGDHDLAATTWPLELSPLSGVPPEERAAVESAVRKGLVQAYFDLGVLQTKAGRLDRAAALYAQAAEIEPGFPRLRYALGTALFNSGRFAAATAPLSRALDETPADDNLRRMLALAWFNAQSYEAAAELLRDDPGRGENPALEYAYAVALVRSGRGAEAEPVFARLLADNADWPELNVLLGQAHAQQDDYQAATKYLERALALKPDVAEAHGTLGDIYLRQGKLAEAEAALRAELRSHPGDRRARYTLAVVLDLDRKPQAALEVLGPLLEEQPDFADGRYLLGKILLAQGAAEEARAQLEAAAALSPEDANIRYQLAQSYQRLDQRDKAQREFEEYRRLKKGDVP